MTDIMGPGEPQDRPGQETDEDVMAEGEPEATAEETERTGKDSDVMDGGGPA